MPGPTSNGMQCHEFDLLLTDMLDGVLSGAQLDGFQAHARSCSACGPLLAEVEAGRNWLKGLAEVEPPASLVNSILASTTGVESQRLRVNTGAQPQFSLSLWERAQAWVSGFVQPVWGTVRQPRFAMSFGMAFFSISVALSMLGVRPGDLKQISLRPAAIRHSFYNTQARVVRYYDNIRFVYELQAAASKIRRNVAPAEPGPAKQKNHKNDTTEQPEQKQERNYTQSQDQVVLASAQLGLTVVDPLNPDLPVALVSTYRRSL
jgi:putative zinc finger protein